MLDPEEERVVAQQFGVARSQVRRDHLISHLLAALSAQFAERLLFFGGTALSRSYVPDGRLSEDVDLIALDSRRDLAADMVRVLPRAIRREYPGAGWRPSLTDVREVEPATLVTPDGTTVRIQLLNRVGYPPWPAERRELVQRYADAATATLTVPTVGSFAAWKTAAWIDRAAARDLYDLWLLTHLGALNLEASQLFRRFGPTNRVPTPGLFARPPDEETWRRELAGQTRLRVTAEQALHAVGEAWRAAAPSALATD